MQHRAWCHSAPASKCHIVTTGPAWPLSLLLSSSQAPSKAVHISFIMFGVFESHIWQIGKAPSVFCPPKVRSIHGGAAQTGETLELLKLCKFLNISQQQGEVLSTVSPLQGDRSPSGWGRAGMSGILWAPWWLLEGTGGWSTHPKEIPSASSQQQGSEMGTPAPSTEHSVLVLSLEGLQVPEHPICH